MELDDERRRSGWLTGPCSPKSADGGRVGRARSRADASPYALCGVDWISPVGRRPSDDSVQGSVHDDSEEAG